MFSVQCVQSAIELAVVFSFSESGALYEHRQVHGGGRCGYFTLVYTRVHGVDTGRGAERKWTFKDQVPVKHFHFLNFLRRYLGVSHSLSG